MSTNQCIIRAEHYWLRPLSFARVLNAGHLDLAAACWAFNNLTVERLWHLDRGRAVSALDVHAAPVKHDSYRAVPFSVSAESVGLVLSDIGFLSIFRITLCILL